ncbi:MAG: ABC transporter permease [Verrucomicrobiales bacterium]|nr:ABC transporter permease [Verrucomicrobiales bacterium]
MSFLTLVIKNLLRRRSRSLLTVIGIAIGIAAVVSLTGLAWGFETSLTNIFRARGTDLIVTKAKSHGAIPGAFPEKIREDLRAMPQVEKSAGILCEVFSVEDSSSTLVVGWEADSPLWAHLKLVNGSWLQGDAPGQIMLGQLLADALGKKPGDAVQVETGEFSVAGIFSSTAVTENGAIVMRLEDMQRLTNRPGLVNFIDVWLKPDTSARDREEIQAAIHSQFKDLKAFGPGGLSQQSTAVQLAKGMGICTSLLAVIIGAVGVTNTILMSVFERLQEIGVLLALGWKRRRILKMILMESLLLSILGGVFGVLLGVVAAHILEAMPFIHGKFETEITAPLLGVGMLVALVLGTLGGLYPAWIGSRMSPANALRQ